jgi:hypothetical protein
MQRLLTTTEIASFLARNPATAAQVAATEAAIAVLGYDQINTPPAWYEIDVNVGLIPTWGVCVQDPVFGTVIVAPTANGTMEYNGFVTAQSCGPVNAPIYQSPTNPPDCDWLCQIGKSLSSDLLFIGIGLGVLFLLGRQK